MAKVIVIYDLPDPDDLLEGEAGEEQRNDLQNWLEADLTGTELDADAPGTICTFSAVEVLSEEEYQQQTRQNP